MLVLIVEDEPRIADFLDSGLRAEGYACAVAPDAASAMVLVRSEPIDLVLLDLVLPDRSGAELLQAIRRLDPRLPILVLTARDDLASKILHLDHGADDYLTKPFAFDELLARIRALLRRDQASGTRLVAGPLELDLRRRSVRTGGREVELSLRETALLELFVRHPNLVLTRAQILSGAWPYETAVESNVVDVYVRYLRRKVPWPETVSLETVRGAGYRLRVA